MYPVYTSSNMNLKRNFYKLYIFSNAAKCLASNMCNIYIKVLKTKLLRKYNKFYHCVV